MTALERRYQGVNTIINSRECGKLRPQVVLLRAGQSQPDPETLQAVEGYTLLRPDRNGWRWRDDEGKAKLAYQLDARAEVDVCATESGSLVKIKRFFSLLPHL